MMRALRALAAAVGLIALGMGAGCDVGRQLSADNDDLADYRAYRLAAAQGARLRLAQEYLEAHPKGRWAGEVREVFDTEEPAFFERCQSSRNRVRDYIVDLPRGPHAAAAEALLVAMDARVEDIETARLMRSARRTEAVLDLAAARRHAVGEAILGAVGALTENGVFGERLENAPVLLRGVLGTDSGATWGGAIRTRHERDLFFVVPTAGSSEARVATLVVTVELDGTGAIIEGRIEGQDLFLRWLETDELKIVDGGVPAHRRLASAHAREPFLGALEARFPTSQCTVAPEAGELLRRACGGWSAVVHPGMAEGDADIVTIRGPLRGEMRY